LFTTMQNSKYVIPPSTRQPYLEASTASKCDRPMIDRLCPRVGSTSGRGLAASKLFPLRGARAETRNRAKDELRRVINAVERVRKWEKRWVALKDSAITVYKWVPVSGQAITPPKPVSATASSILPKNTSESNLAEAAAEEDTNVSAVSPENSNGETTNAPEALTLLRRTARRTTILVPRSSTRARQWEWVRRLPIPTRTKRGASTG